MKRKPKAIPWKQVREELFKDPKVEKAYQDLQPEFTVMQAIIDARIKNKISQTELAKRMGTGQAAISRIENAKGNISIEMIQRLADALNLKFELKFTPRT